MENTTEDKELLLNQWQTCVDMANSVSQRRDNMNNIFITLNLAIMAAVSITWDIKSLFILIAGITICILWMLNIRNYKLLNTAKFNVINSIEEKLPSAPFKDEWQFLDILALGNCGSGKMETGVPDTETILIGLIVSSHGTRNCQAQSRFAVCKQA